MRKDDPLLAVDIDEDGAIRKISQEAREVDLLPLAYRYDRQAGLKKWWNERSIPLRQGRVK